MKKSKRREGRRRRREKGREGGRESHVNAHDQKLLLQGEIGSESAYAPVSSCWVGHGDVELFGYVHHRGRDMGDVVRSKPCSYHLSVCFSGGGGGGVRHILIKDSLLGIYTNTTHRSI